MTLFTSTTAPHWPTAGRDGRRWSAAGGPGRHYPTTSATRRIARKRELILPDHQGKGQSAVTADRRPYRLGRLAATSRRCAAWRPSWGWSGSTCRPLGAGSVALRYAARLPQRIDRLVFLRPGMGALGLEITSAAAGASGGGLREPWYQEEWTAVQAAGCR